MQLQPNSPKFKRDARGATLVFEFKGPMSLLKTYGPAIGDDITLGAFGYEPEEEIVYANSIECTPEVGDDGPGTLVVVYTNVPDAGWQLLVGNQTTVEVDCVLQERPLVQHPRYCTGGANALTDTDRANIQKWRDGEVAYATLSTNAKHFADKVKKGIESYFAPAPLTRKTTRGGSMPSVSSVGTRSATAPATGAPAGYEWLKSADRGIRQAPAMGWERVEEWLGAKEIDADLYTGVI